MELNNKEKAVFFNLLNIINQTKQTWWQFSDPYADRKNAHTNPSADKRVQTQNKSNITIENNKKNILFNKKEKKEWGNWTTSERRREINKCDD